MTNLAFANHRPTPRREIRSLLLLSMMAVSVTPTLATAANSPTVQFNETIVGQKSPGRRVRVHLVSGRILSGDLDSRSSTERLWLRTGGTSAAVLRPIDWNRVLQVERGQEVLTPDEFQQKMHSILKEPLSTEVDETEPVQNPAGLVPQPDPISHAERVHRALQTEIPLEHSADVPPVRSISTSAYLAQWDADVEADGLILHLYPLSANGECLKVHGTLQADLTGYRERGIAPVKFGQWTKMIRPEDFGPYGAQVKLPFQAFDPQFQLDLQRKGLLHVTFTVPGHGKFESSISPVRLQPVNAFRDGLEQRTGKRYFDFERTGRSQ